MDTRTNRPPITLRGRIIKYPLYAVGKHSKHFTRANSPIYTLRGLKNTLRGRIHGPTLYAGEFSNAHSTRAKKHFTRANSRTHTLRGRKTLYTGEFSTKHYTRAKNTLRGRILEHTLYPAVRTRAKTRAGYPHTPIKHHSAFARALLSSRALRNSNDSN